MISILSSTGTRTGADGWAACSDTICAISANGVRCEDNTPSAPLSAGSASMLACPFSGEESTWVDLPSRSSSSRTSFQEHLACFFVQPMQAVRFLRQSMCNLRHRSQGGRILSPRCNDSILFTISALYGPPSSRSICEGFEWGSNDAGVFGIATAAAVLRAYSPAVSRDSDLGFVLVDEICTGVDLVMPAEDRLDSSSLRASRSAEEKNFFINSARRVGEAPLIEVPLMIVTLSVFAVGNKSCAALLVAVSGEVSVLASTGADCRVLTAVKPLGGDCDIPGMPLDLPLSPCVSSVGGGELCDRRIGIFVSTSDSLLLMIAALRPLSR